MKCDPVRIVFGSGPHIIIILLYHPATQLFSYYHLFSKVNHFKPLFIESIFNHIYLNLMCYSYVYQFPSSNQNLTHPTCYLYLYLICSHQLSAYINKDLWNHPVCEAFFDTTNNIQTIRGSKYCVG